MALPLTVKTETALAFRHLDPQNTTTDPETGDRMIEAAPHMPTTNLEDPNELERRSIQIDLEIPAGSRSTTKTLTKITNATPEALTETSIEDLPSHPTYDTMIGRDIPRSDHERAAGLHTALVEEEIDMQEEEDLGEMTIGMVDTEMTLADPTYMAMKK